MEEKTVEFSIDLDFKKKTGMMFNSNIDDDLLPDMDDEDRDR